MTGRLRAAAPVIDLACLALFVLAGRDSHDMNGGASWFLGVLWPLALGWFAAALATRLYTERSRPWLRLAGTWALGMTIALIARGLVLGRAPATIFALILFGFVALATFGWRALARLARRVVPTRA